MQAKTLQAENSSLRQRQRSLEVLQLERDELSRQLDSAKDDLLREQKQGRLHREEMAEVRLVLAFWWGGGGGWGLDCMGCEKGGRGKGGEREGEGDGGGTAGLGLLVGGGGGT